MNKRRITLTVVAAAAALVLSGCANDSIRDYEEAEVKDPNTATIWNNVDGHPNVVRLCTDGIAWATTTRDYTSIERVPEWDAHCASVGDKPSLNTD